MNYLHVAFFVLACAATTCLCAPQLPETYYPPSIDDLPGGFDKLCLSRILAPLPGKLIILPPGLLPGIYAALTLDLCVDLNQPGIEVYVFVFVRVDDALRLKVKIAARVALINGKLVLELAAKLKLEAGDLVGLFISGPVIVDLRLPLLPTDYTPVPNLNLVTFLVYKVVITLAGLVTGLLLPLTSFVTLNGLYGYGISFCAANVLNLICLDPVLGIVTSLIYGLPALLG